MLQRNSMNVGAVILAAGSSSRMGVPKQTLQFQGKSLLRRAVIAALDASCCPVVVVTGAHAELSRRELDQLDVREAFNPNWETGMGSSVRAGIERLISIDPGVAAVVLLLCDQPYVTPSFISSLIAGPPHSWKTHHSLSVRWKFRRPGSFQQSAVYGVDAIGRQVRRERDH
jgi:CTP:molybdopterin cytidylyltransferase MocA